MLETDLITSIGEFGKERGVLITQGAGQAVVNGVLLLLFNFCMSSEIVTPSG